MTIIGQIHACFGQKGNYTPPISSWLNHSIACFCHGLNVWSWLCKWSNLECRVWGPVSSLRAPVQCRCHPVTRGWHQLEHTSRDSFPVRGEVGRSLQGSGNYYLKYFSIVIWHPRCHNVTRHVSWLLDLPRDTVTRARHDCYYPVSGDIGPWYPGSQLSELYIVGNHPAGIISPLSRDIVCLHSVIINN